MDFAKFLEMVKAGQPDQPGEEPDPKVLEFLRILEQYRRKCEKEGNYLEADRAHQQLEMLRKQEEKRQQKAVRARQIAERQDVQIAHNMQYTDFNAAWDKSRPRRRSLSFFRPLPRTPRVPASTEYPRPRHGAAATRLRADSPRLRRGGAATLPPRNIHVPRRRRRDPPPRGIATSPPRPRRGPASAEPPPRTLLVPAATPPPRNTSPRRYLEEYDRMAQIYIQQMTERHATNLLEFQRKLQSEMSERPPKWSRELLEWRRRQHMLARQKNYAEAQRIKKIADKLEEKERRGCEQITGSAFARKDAQFRQQQQAELQALLKRKRPVRRSNVAAASRRAFPNARRRRFGERRTKTPSTFRREVNTKSVAPSTFRREVNRRRHRRAAQGAPQAAHVGFEAPAAAEPQRPGGVGVEAGRRVQRDVHGDPQEPHAVHAAGRARRRLGRVGDYP